MHPTEVKITITQTHGLTKNCKTENLKLLGRRICVNSSINVELKKELFIKKKKFKKLCRQKKKESIQIKIINLNLKNS